MQKVIRFTALLRFKWPGLAFLDVATLEPTATAAASAGGRPQWVSPTGHEGWSKTKGTTTTVGLRLALPFANGLLVYVAFLGTADESSAYETLAVVRPFGETSVCKFDVPSRYADPDATVLVALTTLECADESVLTLLDKAIDSAATLEDCRAWLIWAEKQLRRPLIDKAASARLMQRCWDSSAWGRARGNEPESAPQPTLRTRSASPQHNIDIRWLLDQCGALETGCDYELASGLHSNVFVNTARLCESELHMRAIARSINAVARDIEFDTVVAYGWQLTAIARRFIREYSHERHVTLISVEGYRELTWSTAPSHGSRVLVLTDIVVTGQFQNVIRTCLAGFGSVCTATVPLVDARQNPRATDAIIRGLTRVKIELRHPDQCERCAVLPKKVFNPISCAMTTKAPSRTPTEFLTAHPDAKAFWEAVDEAHAYEHHHVEGGKHYTNFINTSVMLTHPTIGPMIVGRLRERILEKCPTPDIILVPRRARGYLLGRSLAEAFSQLSGRSPRLMRPLKVGDAETELGDSVSFKGLRVLVADAAAGHGQTLDELSLFALDRGAQSVAAAVVVSRLSEAHEEALCKRLGVFLRLYHVPIRPIAVPESLRMLCPVCKERDSLLDVAHSSRAHPVRAFAIAKLKPRPRGQHKSAPARKPLQLVLFEKERRPEFLEGCRRSVAAGVVAHALHSSMNNGMAALALPEIVDERIPVSNRAAMLHTLPSSVIQWSGTHIMEPINQLLMKSGEPRLCLASIDLLVRAGRYEWLSYLGNIANAIAGQERPAMLTNELSYYLCRSVASDADLRRHALDQLKTFQRDASGEQKQIIDVLWDAVTASTD